MLEVSGLSRKFGAITAVDCISFKVARGEVLGFLGPNGAGKSTTMKMITGYLAQTAGRVTLFEKDTTQDPIGIKSSMGYLPEGAPCYGDMTVGEFLYFIAEIRQLKSKTQEAISRVVALLHLEPVFFQTIETLSKGFKRRVGLAQAIIHDPDVLILDEPTDGLDPNQKHEVRELIRAMAKDKIIIISTHILEEVAAVTTRAIIINQGKIVADATPRDLIQQSSKHGAVQIELTAPLALSEVLTALPQVSRVETIRDGHSYLVYPEGGAKIFPIISEVSCEKKWPLSACYCLEGELDEVFRQLTMKDAA